MLTSLTHAAGGAFLLAGVLASPLHAQAVADVQVTPETMTLAVGQKQAIFAAAFDRQGNLIPNARFTFWTSDSSVARVQRDGTVSGVKPGLAKVEARAQGKRASLAVLVAGPGGVVPGAPGAAHGIAALTLEPASLRLVLGEAARLVPRALADDGTSVEVGRVGWKSLRPDVVAVDSTGAVLARGAGRSIIQAALSNGMVATAPVEVETVDLALSKSRVVVGPEGFDTLEVVVPGQANRVLSEGVVWRSSDTSVVRVGPTGIVQGVKPGTAEIVAWLAGQERRAAVLVHKAPRALVLTPRTSTAPIQLPLKRKRKFSVLAEAVDSTPIPEIRVAWGVDDTTIATFDPATNELAARALGTTSLTARVGGFAPASWAVQVVPGAVRLDRERLALAPGARAELKAALADDEGKAMGPAPDLTWVSDQPAVVAVDERGAVEAKGLGRAKVTATTPWGAAAAVEVFVIGDLLYASNRSGTFGIYQAFAAKPDSLLPVLVDSAANTTPVFSPDRTRIAFSSNRAARDGNYDLYVMDADGSNIRRLTTDPGADGEPAWSPDGGKLVFSGVRAGVTQIYVVPGDGGEARALTSSVGGNQSPAVSPDGRRVAFVSLRDKGPRVYLMGIDGSGQTRISTAALREGVPRFFPNGDLGYGVERSSGSREWRVMRAPEGAPGMALFQTEQPLLLLSPSRDGDRVVYVSGRVAVGSRGRSEYKVWFRGLGLSAAPVPLRVRPTEQVSSASF